MSTRLCLLSLRQQHPILYAGVMSCGAGYTLQVVAQNGVDPTVASLLLSPGICIFRPGRSMLLGQKLSGRELSGCVCVCSGAAGADTDRKTVPYSIIKI